MNITIILYHNINHYLRLLILIVNMSFCLLDYQIFRMSLKLIPHCSLYCFSLVFLYISVKCCLYHCLLTVHMILNNKINLFNLLYILIGPCLNQILTSGKADGFN